METLTEKVKRFLTLSWGSGSGWGSGEGSGSGLSSGEGSGEGWGLGSGSGSGSGSGWGSGWGWGWGSGSGWGSGEGSGEGLGLGSGEGLGLGSGSGSGEGSGLSSGEGSGEAVISFNGFPVYWVDDEPTLIYRVHSNVARGAILNGDLTLTDCVIVRDDRHFAHGETLQKATEALREKAFDDMDEDERIDAFLEAFPDLDVPIPNRELYDWHHRLTGSCEMGRDTFVRNHGIDLDGKTSVRDFLKLVRDSYGREIIRAVEGRINA